MKPLLVSLSFYLFLCNILFAQDVIYKHNNTKVEANVLEVGPLAIKYKTWSNPDGPVYVISRNEVALIVFRNGTHEVITPGGSTSASYAATDDSLSRTFGRHFISTNIFTMLFTQVSLKYEYFTRSGRLSLGVPLSYGIDYANRINYYTVDNFWEYEQNKYLSAAIEINYFPKGQGRSRYFLGATFEVGSFYYYYRTYSSYWGGPYYPGTKYLGYHIAGMVNNGMLVQVTRDLNFSYIIGLGLFTNSTRYNDSPRTKLHTAFNIGYRF